MLLHTGEVERGVYSYTGHFTHCSHTQHQNQKPLFHLTFNVSVYILSGEKKSTLYFI